MVNFFCYTWIDEASLHCVTQSEICYTERYFVIHRRKLLHCMMKRCYTMLHPKIIRYTGKWFVTQWRKLLHSSDFVCYTVTHWGKLFHINGILLHWERFFVTHCYRLLYLLHKAIFCYTIPILVPLCWHFLLHIVTLFMFCYTKTLFVTLNGNICYTL